jgi:hypothetical protein
MSNEFLVSALSPISTELRASLVEAIASVRTTLQGISQNRDRFYSVFGQAFGNSFKATVAETIRSQWSSGDFSQSPVIQILDSGMNGALGAYAISNNRIYLDASLLADNQSQTLVSVLLEEIGHSLDAQINSVDTVGDEGAVFAALVQGEILSEKTLLALRAEDDRAIITINGQDVAIEQQTFTGTAGNDTITGTAGDDVINAGLGNDNVDGGEGNDLLIVDYSSNTYAGTSPAAAGMTGSTYSNGNGGFNGYFSAYRNSAYDQDSTSFSNIERFQITGTSANDDITTGDGNDIITTGIGNDTIDGGEGNDIINAGIGNDIINNNKGVDTIDGDDGSDTLVNANFALATQSLSFDDTGVTHTPSYSRCGSSHCIYC